MDKSKLPRHKLEELRRKEDEKNAEHVYKEFVEAFDVSKKQIGKAFIRGEVVNAASGEKSSVHKPNLYKPPPTIVKKENPFETARKMAEEKARKAEEAAAKIRPQKPGKKEAKPKSNLEAFKEELRRLQEEREARRNLRYELKKFGMETEPLDRIAPSLDNPYLNSYESDPMTTNLFTSNLNPKSTEEDVCRAFGRFGPLASVKIMWPRTDDERNRGYLTGFVAFMTRKDADRAALFLRGKEVNGYEVKLNWGKPVPIPQHPVYVPPKMLEMTLPPPPSGLPFNAQPRKEDREAFQAKWQVPPAGSPQITDPEKREAWEKMLRNAVVKVVIPTERPLLCLIHRTIEFVVREGPMFEAMIMSKEINNPSYRFLFDNQSPAHVYYRWKLFSILQGDSPSKWRMEEFRMFENGSVWRPPPVNFFHQGLPVELYEESEKMEKDSTSAPSPRRRRSSDDSPSHEHESKSTVPIISISSQQASQDRKKSALNASQRTKLTNMLNNLTPEREKIADAMLYCVDHAEAAEEIVAMIEDGIADPDGTLTKKIAKLYLVADILSNGAAKVMNVSYYRKFIANRLEAIFRHLHSAYARIDARLRAEQFKQRVMACCRFWEDTAMYTTDFLIRLQNIFLGLAMDSAEIPQQKEVDLDGEEMEDLEGTKLDDVEVNGSRETAVAVGASGSKPLVDYDLDGVPLEDEDEAAATTNAANASGVQPLDTETGSSAKPAFVRSKWETVEPEIVEQQAMTLSKWEQEQEISGNAATTISVSVDYAYEDDLDGVPMEDAMPAPVSSQSAAIFRHESQTINKNEMSEEKRQLLREIEVKVMKYQDELESGQRSKSDGASVKEDVEKYRQKLLKEIDDKSKSTSVAVHQSSRKSDEKEKKPTSESTRTKKHDSPATSAGAHESEKKHERDSNRKKRRSRSRSSSQSRDSRRSKHSKKSRSRSKTPSGRSKKRKH